MTEGAFEGVDAVILAEQVFDAEIQVQVVYSSQLGGNCLIVVEPEDFQVGETLEVAEYFDVSVGKMHFAGAAGAFGVFDGQHAPRVRNNLRFHC